MSITVRIELDKELKELIETNLNQLTKTVVDFINILEKFTGTPENLKEEPSSIQVEKKPPVKKILQDEKENPAQESIKSDIESESDKREKNRSEKRRKSATEKSTETPKKKRTALGVVFSTIKRSNHGINVEELKQETGFDAKKVADAVYRLKKTGKIDKTAAGLYIALQ